MKHKEPKLPARQLLILAICRFAEPISLTSIFPYLPEFIASFRVAEQDIAFWAGLSSAIFSLAQCLTAIAWGKASDRYGRKYIILLGLTNTMATQLIWGFSTSLPMALAARALGGAGNGNVGIIRTVVAELCPWKELQPRAFSIMPLVYNIGSVLGPSFGGALSNPLGKDPYDDTKRSDLLWKYPYALPNLVAACFFLVGIMTGILFLEETLASRKHKRDAGLIVGARLQSGLQTLLVWTQNLCRRRENPETQPLLSGSTQHILADEENTVSPSADQIEEKAPGIKEVLNKQTSLNLLTYALLATHSIAFDQLLPVFMSYPRSGADYVVEPHLPFKFNHGFGIKSSQIGLLFTCYGVVGIFYQFIIFPPVARKYGTLKCLRVVLTVMPIVYFVAPFSTLVPSVRGAQITLLAIWLIKGLCSTFAFPCSTILLTNTASSLKVLGTVNGIATSVSAIGRAAGPTIGGAVFSTGVKQGYIVAPFWTLSMIGLLAPIASLWLVEGKGFGDDDDDMAGEENETTDEVPPLPSHQSTILRRSSGDHLRRVGSYDSQVISESDEDRDVEGSSPQPISTSVSRWRATQSGGANADAIKPAEEAVRQQQQRVRRRSSAGVGMGIGFRRTSSNLGHTRSGYGGGGGLDAFTRT